jgi:hypothetical protein
MLYDNGGLLTAKRLIGAPTPSEGFTKLWEMRRLDLSVEAVALQPEFRSLFTNAERFTARERLKQYEYSAS